MCLGPFGRVCHWGPLLALGIVKSITLMSLHCITMWWPPTKSLGGFANLLLFTTWNGLVLYHFFTAMVTGPGYIPFGWTPESPDDNKYLQYCHECKGYKSPRAHHCRKCKRCIMKMDHHCPWINNCCGHRNHANFTLFLIFAVCGCIHGTYILGCSLYRAIYKNWYRYYSPDSEPLVHLSLPAFVFGMFSLGMAIGVIIAVGTLFIIQMRCIWKNETGVENWIVAKATRPRPNGEKFIYPYNLGWRENLRQAFSEECQGDGITWPVVQGCNQYTLTVEQMAQKEEKRQRTREYTIVEVYGGSIFPMSKGFKVCCSPPLSDEARIPLAIGDKVLVTRWKRHWLYGEKSLTYSTLKESDDQSGLARLRGWFPRKCAVEIINGDGESHKKIAARRAKKEE